MCVWENALRGRSVFTADRHYTKPVARSYLKAVAHDMSAHYVAESRSGSIRVIDDLGLGDFSGQKLDHAVLVRRAIRRITDFFADPGQFPQVGAFARLALTRVGCAADQQEHAGKY